MDEEIQLSDEEKEQISKKRILEENVKKCSIEISEILKKYNLTLQITKPEIIIVPKRNDQS